MSNFGLIIWLIILTSGCIFLWIIVYGSNSIKEITKLSDDSIRTLRSLEESQTYKNLKILEDDIAKLRKDFEIYENRLLGKKVRNKEEESNGEQE